MSKRKFILSTIISILAVFLVLPSYASAEEASRICNGVFIDEVDVSGMTKDEAEQAVADFVKGLQAKGLAIRVGEDVVYTTLGDLGYTSMPNDYVEQALAIGTKGNLIKRYKDLKDIEQGNIVYPLYFTIDDSKLNELVETQVGAYNIAPVNASVKRKNDKMIYTDHVIGKKVEIADTVQIIKDAIFNNWNRTDILVDAVMAEDMPLYTRDIVEKCNTILGTFTTEYASSAEGRAANLANGAKLINNAVIYPGEIFSGYEYLSPFTVENGYYNAGAYLNGRTIDSIGGGACQVTTTLYNAALFAELEIVQRNAHSMTISYVDLSRDAAIAGTVKDLKFKNNTDVPILIEAYTVGRTITFNIWGHETRDMKGRRIEYVTKVLSETPPPEEVITKDPTKPVTFKDVEQSAHTGYKAELYKVIYENGKEIERVLINKSYYAPAPRRVTIGTKPVESEAPKDDSKNKNEEAADDTINDDNIIPEDEWNEWDPAWDDEDYEDE